MSSIEEITGLEKEWRELFDKIRTSKGARIQGRFEAFHTSVTFFKGNEYDLLLVLDALREPQTMIKLLGTENEQELESYVAHVARFFHNYLASAKTLVDHTRVMKDELYTETDFDREYDHQVDEHLKRNPTVQFVQQLRNYMLHKAPPFIAWKVHLGPMGRGVDLSIVLGLKALRKWDKWNAPSRQYLDGLGDETNLRDVVGEYGTAMNKFYKWFLARQRKFHEKELREFRLLTERLDYVERKLSDSRRSQ